ncbi:hypothetical protein EMCRGX_G000838 [Ephydatia muelleri]
MAVEESHTICKGPEKEIKNEEIEVLFEYKGFRKACKATLSTLCLCIQQQLRSVGEPEATVSIAGSEGDEQACTFLLQRWSHKWKAFVNVGSVLEILDDDKVTVTHKPVSSPSKASGPVVLAFFVLGLCATEKSRSSNCVLNGASSAKSPYERSSGILERVKKPTEVEARALAKCFPSGKSKKEGFDPNAECVVADAQAKKKAAFKGKQRSVSVNVVMLKHYQEIIPRGNTRKELFSQERIKRVSVTRDMSNLQIRNAIIRAFKVSSFSFLESDKKGHLTRFDNDSLDGEGAVKRRGCLYLCEIDDSEAVPEHPTKKFKPSVDSGAHCSKDLASSDWNETVQQSSDNTGKASPREVIDLGSGSESDNESELGRAQAYIEEARQIRKEQDEAYQQSLEADKAKAKAEREQLQDIRKDLSRQWSNKLTQPEGMKFTLRFSDSSKTECRLLPLTSSKVLYEIATAYGNVTKGFSIHTIIPRELVPVTCQVKDISSSVLIVEEGENAPDLLTFVRETLGQAETQEEQVMEEVKDGSQLIQRDHVYEDVIKTYEDNLEEILKDYPFRVRFINEKAVDMGGVCRDLFSAFWEDSYVKIFDGEKLLVPAVRPNPDMAVLCLHGTILSHGFMVCGFLPIRIAFPVLAAIFFGPEVEVPDSIILDSFIDYLAAYESSFISQALTKVQNNNQLPSTLQGQIISTLSRMGCVQVPTKANLKEVVVSTARHLFLGKPLGVLYTIHSGVPKLFLRFFQTMTVSEFFGLYKALNATSERVLDLIEEPSAMNSAEKRIFSYLITFVSNSRQDDLRLFLRFVTGRSVLLGESIRVSFNNTEGLARSPTAKTCSCAIELPLSYSTYPEFEQELSKVLSSEAGNRPAVLGAMHSIEEMGPALDLYSNFFKCELFSSKGNTSFPPAVKYSLLPNLDILGAPIGDY